MAGKIVAVTLALCVSGLAAQQSTSRPKFESFDVATVKPVDPGPQSSRFIAMQGPDRFVAKNYTVKLLIAAAYDLNSRTISGGPQWIDSAKYDIVAVAPGTVTPDHDEQMAMLRKLLTDRFNLKFHREEKVFSIYQLVTTKDGPKLKASAAGTDEPAVVGPGVVYPQRVSLPARNATMGNFVSLLQRAILDRPVVDKTGLTGRYDFVLDWAPDDTQFGGDLRMEASNADVPPLFTAIQEQLGLQLISTKGPVSALVVDHAEPPSAN
jgi:uncharacterized protein (TIGR03435 family)